MNELKQKTFIPDASPWEPMSEPIDLMVAGKLAEELGECSAAISRCIIQGIDEAEPSTGEVNRKWLEKEIADVLANIDCACERFGLDTEFIAQRRSFKTGYLRKWHSLDGSAYQSQEPVMKEHPSPSVGEAGYRPYCGGCTTMRRMQRKEEFFKCSSCGLETRIINGVDMFDQTAPIDRHIEDIDDE